MIKPVLPASLAIALATIVLPHPGGPCNNKPGRKINQYQLLNQISHFFLVKQFNCWCTKNILINIL